MNTRPTSITVISWILIVISLISLVAGTASLNDPMTIELMSRSPLPISLQHAMMYFGLLVQLVSGIAMLKCKNWGRLLYSIWGVIGLVIGLLTSPVKMMLIPGTIFFAVIVFLLFRPKANEYFKQISAKSNP